MGYDMRYEGGTRILTSEPSYPAILRVAKDRAARFKRTVVITVAFDGTAYMIVRPDGSVSRPPEGYEG